jgi:hypothetical protein
MKPWRKWGLAGSLLLIATLVLGDSNVLNKGTYYQNATNGAKVDVNGNAYVTESAPSANNYSYQPSVISAIFSNIPDGKVVAGLRTNKDSTSVIDCRGYNRAALYLFPSTTLTTDAGGGDADSLYGALLGLEVRGFSGSVADSQSTFRAIGHRVGSTGFGGVQDTVGSLSDIIKTSNHIAGYGPIQTSLLPSETAVVVSGMWGGSTSPAPGSCRGMIIWSSKIGEAGAAATPPFIGFRIRYLKAYTMASGNIVATDSTTALPMRIRCDLALWRE